MKFYNAKIKNSFQMQFGFQSPNWNRCSVNSLDLQDKTKKKKKK